MSARRNLHRVHSAFPFVGAWLKRRLARALAPSSFPTRAFSTARAPPSPDYSSAAAWAAHPSFASTAQTVAEGEAPIDPEASRPADLFFVHPTTYFGSEWNAPFDHPPAASQLDETIIGTQAAVFNRVCRIYAPRYRQMQYAGFFADPATARPACDLAYSDVRAAFEHFLATRSGGDCDDEDEEAKAPRPIFLAAHSQGALHMARLLDDVVERRPALARNVVACYCIGMGLRRDSFEHHSRDDEDAEIFRLRPSSGPAQINALVSWNLRAAASSFGEANFVQTGVGPGHWSRARGGWYDDDAAVAGTGSALLQTSPLTWISNVGGGSVNDSGDAEDLTHLGVALPSFAPAFDPREMMNDEVFPSRLVALHRKKFGKRRPPYTATTTDYEVVVGNLSPSLSQMDMGQGVGDLHVMDFSLFFFNVRKNVQVRLEAFLRLRREGKDKETDVPRSKL